jgi:hypothetical protein
MQHYLVEVYLPRSRAHEARATGLSYVRRVLSRSIQRLLMPCVLQAPGWQPATAAAGLGWARRARLAFGIPESEPRANLKYNGRPSSVETRSPQMS